jgi:phosphate starvation-inducible protein PhoH
MLDLLGQADANFKALEAAFPQVVMVARGNEVSLSGPAPEVEEARTVLDELLILVQEGERLDVQRLEQIVSMVRASVPSPAGILSDGVAVGRGKLVRPKTHGQHRYISAIRENTVTFGIGPAGTGKTYLAMAVAVEALASGAVRRIIPPAPRSRQESVWDSCLVTSLPKSTRICGRCMTPFGTCSDPRKRPALPRRGRSRSLPSPICAAARSMMPV